MFIVFVSTKFVARPGTIPRPYDHIKEMSSLMETSHDDITVHGALLSIDVDTDDYAETAASDTPTVSRTYQSEDSFQAEKLSYTAKIQGEPGTTYRQLMGALPGVSRILESRDAESTRLTTKANLSKKDAHLLGYVVGELYYDRDFQRVLRLCEAVRAVCDVDKKSERNLDRWKARCTAELEKQSHCNDKPTSSTR
nr:hypothetical protein CFP56_43781 [Quercus suber]